MAVSSLREITIGVEDLPARVHQFETGCGLSVMASGGLAPITTSRLFEMQGAPRVAVMGRPDVSASPRIRLVELTGPGTACRSGVASPGPLGVGFTTRGIGSVYARLQASALNFVSPPLLLPAVAAPTPEGHPLWPERFEAFGHATDGDFIGLIEGMNSGMPYGTIQGDCSEPLHASFVVTNLDASLHFMSDVLEHETLIRDTCSGPPFDALLGLPAGVAFRFAMVHRKGFPTGRAVFMEFETKRQPMSQTPGLGRGLCRVRYDTTDLHLTLGRVPGGGGALVRGPASIDDPILGQGMVAMVRSPFGVLIELWQAL